MPTSYWYIIIYLVSAFISWRLGIFHDKYVEDKDREYAEKFINIKRANEIFALIPGLNIVMIFYTLKDIVRQYLRNVMVKKLIKNLTDRLDKGHEGNESTPEFQNSMNELRKSVGLKIKKYKNNDKT